MRTPKCVPVTLLIAVSLLFGPPPAFSQEDETGLQSVPSLAARQAARAKIKDRFGFDQKLSKYQRQILSSKLLSASREIDEDSDSAMKFALLNMSRELAASAGDTVGALRAITVMENDFRFDVFAIKVLSLRSVGEASDLSLREKSQLLSVTQQLLDEKYKAADFENSAKLCEFLIQLATKFKNSAVLRETQAQLKRIQSGEAQKDVIVAARAKAKRDPNDSEANWMVAKHELLHGEGWDAAVPFLENTTQPFGVSSAMHAEKMAPETGGYFYAGQSWLEVANRIDDPAVKEVFQLHALGLFMKSERDSDGSLPDFVRFEIEKLERQGVKAAPAEMKPAEPMEQVPSKLPLGTRRLQEGVFDLRWASFAYLDVLEAINVSQHKISEGWRKENRILYSPTERFDRMRMPFVFPEQYDLQLECKKVSGNGNLVLALPAATGHRFLVSIDGQRNFDVSGIETIDRVSVGKNSTRHDGKLLQEGQKSFVEVLVRRNAITVKVDGTQIVHYTGAQEVLSCRGRGPWHDKQDLAPVLGTYEGGFEFSRIVLRSITDKMSGWNNPENHDEPSGTARVGFRRGDTSFPLEVLTSPKVYLDEVPEAAFFVGAGTMGRGGQRGYGKDPRVIVGGKQLRHAISTHPPPDGATHVQYHLNGEYKTLTIQPGVTDNGINSKYQLQFLVYGDGQLLRQSEEPVTRPGIVDTWKIDVTGIKTLMLMVQCGKNKERACAIWANPLLERTGTGVISDEK